MASFNFQLSFFFLFVLILSPEIQAREGKVFSLFTHFKTILNVKDPQEDLPKKPKAESPAPAPALALEPVAEPTGSIIASGPAPEPGFVDRGDGYGLYGSNSDQYYSPTKETPSTTTFENEILNEDFNGESYKTSYPNTNTNLYNNNNNYNPSSYNNEEYRGNYNNDYNKKYVDTYSNNNNEQFSNNYNGNEYNNNNYERKREGTSDTRFMENGKYMTHDSDNYNLNEYESERGNIENESYYEKRQYPNEFDTMEEYEKQQESQGYTP